MTLNTLLNSEKGSHGITIKDSGPLETKAGPFYYDLEKMEEDLGYVLPRLEVPPNPSWPGKGADGFPGERRVQVHVVAPFRATSSSSLPLPNRLSDSDSDSGSLLLPPANDPKLIRSFQLVALFFSDYGFLRMGFPFGPKGEKCSASARHAAAAGAAAEIETPTAEKGEAETPTQAETTQTSCSPDLSYTCDIFRDRYNDVYDPNSVQKMLEYFETTQVVDWASHPPLLKKNYIVGVREPSTYRGSSSGSASTTGGTGEKIMRLGFEIRKGGEGYQDTLRLARRIAAALGGIRSSTFGSAAAVNDVPAGGAEGDEGSVSVNTARKGGPIPLQRVLDFAKRGRMRSVPDSAPLLERIQGFCSEAFRIAKLSPGEAHLVNAKLNPAEVESFLKHLHRISGMSQDLEPRYEQKLWQLLALLLCSDWGILVGPEAKSELEALEAKRMKSFHLLLGFPLRAGGGDHAAAGETLRKVLADYAYQLSELF